MRVEDIKADSRLNPQAKNDDVKAIAAEANAKGAALGKAYEAQLRDEAESIRRRLWSSPDMLNTSERIAQDASYRDAMERARRTDPNRPAELIELFKSASMISDSLQQRAAMTVGLERGNDEVLNGWVSEHPADLDRMQRLIDLNQSINSVKLQFQRAMFFAATL